MCRSRLAEEDNSGGGKTKGVFIMSVWLFMKQLLEAGVHFGHQTRRSIRKWQPTSTPSATGSTLSTCRRRSRSWKKPIPSFVTWRPRRMRKPAVRRHQEAGTGRHAVRSRARRPVLCQRKMARRYADQLPYHAYPDRPSGRCAEVKDGTFAMLPKKEVIKHQGEIAKLEKYLGGSSRT